MATTHTSLPPKPPSHLLLPLTPLGQHRAPAFSSASYYKSPLAIHLWASLVAQMVKNLSAMQEIWVQTLGRKIPLKREWLQCSCLENSMNRGAWRATVHGVSKSQTWPSDKHTHTHTYTHIHFIYGNEYVSMLLSQVMPPSPSCPVTIHLFIMSVSPLLPCK